MPGELVGNPVNKMIFFKEMATLTLVTDVIEDLLSQESKMAFGRDVNGHFKTSLNTIFTWYVDSWTQLKTGNPVPQYSTKVKVVNFLSLWIIKPVKWKTWNTILIPTNFPSYLQFCQRSVEKSYPAMYVYWVYTWMFHKQWQNLRRFSSITWRSQHDKNLSVHSYQNRHNRLALHSCDCFVYGGKVPCVRKEPYVVLAIIRVWYVQGLQIPMHRSDQNPRCVENLLLLSSFKELHLTSRLRLQKWRLLVD